MSTTTTISEADRKAASEAQEFADRLMTARGIDNPEDALATAFRDLMWAADRHVYKHALARRAEADLTDDELDELREHADVGIIIRSLINSYSVEEVASWVREEAEAEAEAEAALAGALAGEDDEHDED